ncbi:MAG: PTS fructose transporter subunit IIA [Gammaproteobacteria bacterium]|nr:PTS fructose transporter subunit IIA [Gammaproteobacteria bacterium]
MSVGLIIITHHHVGENMLQMAIETFGNAPLRTGVFSIAASDSRDEVKLRLEHYIKRIDEGDGILVLTDIYGSTPSNLACCLLEQQRIKVISGINLPMLIKVFNYADAPLDELTRYAIQGAHDGIILCNDDVCQTPPHTFKC